MIYIDASRYNNTARRTGVENYSCFLISELIRQNPDGITLISPREIDLPVPQVTIPFPRLWTQVRLSWEVWRNKKIDNLFVPSHLMPVIHPKNTTITIHDVAFKRFPESYGVLSRWYLDWGAKFAVKHAKQIIVPSETTRDDLIKFYKADEGKITVIPLGFEPDNTETTADEIDETLGRYHLNPRHYFLFVGRIESKKNLEVLIKAFETVHKRHPYLKLVLAGKKGVGGEEIIGSISNKNIMAIGYISDKAKMILYRHCLAFVFPSLFEGFGLPLLEAMSAHVPIIASKIPTSYEIAKNNALFFDPEDSEMLAQHIKTLVEQKEWWGELIKNHDETLQNYSWKRCAEKTLGALRNQ
ncbi:glycosyltransferase family 4 protein [Candidatus Peregrinibacteria bacterium]|nr:glycosyltransferase family 4 protein [Candidatus Peregrinibacteria bacterium]